MLVDTFLLKKKKINQSEAQMVDFGPVIWSVEARFERLRSALHLVMSTTSSALMMPAIYFTVLVLGQETHSSTPRT